MAREPESQSFMDLFARFGKELKLPNMDIERVLEHHRKNIEALEKSARASAAGAASVLARQRQMLEAALHEASDMARSYHAPGTPQELMSKQIDFARKSFESAVQNAGEVAELMKKSGTESLDILRARIKDAMEEIRTGYERK
jgi:phasin family protein